LPKQFVTTSGFARKFLFSYLIQFTILMKKALRGHANTARWL